MSGSPPGPRVDHGSPEVLPVAEGFRRWAPTYQETALSLLEVRAFAAVAPSPGGRRLLDAGCGTGRRLPMGVPPPPGRRRPPGVSPDPGRRLPPGVPQGTAGWLRVAGTPRSTPTAPSPLAMDLAAVAAPPGGAVDLPALAVGVDLSPAMLRRARAEAPPLAAPARRHLVLGELGALPFGDGSFDLAWCRLTVGFLPSLAAPLAELARVLAPGGELVLTELHPECVDEGSVRSFRDADGVLAAVEHHLHPAAALIAAAAAAGLGTVAREELVVGEAVRYAFDAPGAERVYRELLGRPAVLALRLQRR